MEGKVRVLIQLGLLTFGGLLLLGCQTTRESFETTTVTAMELVGTQDAFFCGYYLSEGAKIPVWGSLPEVIIAPNVTECVFWKVHGEDTLKLVAYDGTSSLDFTATPGIEGIQLHMNGGWRVNPLSHQ